MVQRERRLRGLLRGRAAPVRDVGGRGQGAGTWVAGGRVGACALGRRSPARAWASGRPHVRAPRSPLVLCSRVPLARLSARTLALGTGSTSTHSLECVPSLVTEVESAAARLLDRFAALQTVVINTGQIAILRERAQQSHHQHHQDHPHYPHYPHHPHHPRAANGRPDGPSSPASGVANGTGTGTGGGADASGAGGLSLLLPFRRLDYRKCDVDSDGHQYEGRPVPVGAADSFFAGFAAALCHGVSTPQALLWAYGAGQLCALEPLAQLSGGRRDVRRLLSHEVGNALARAVFAVGGPARRASTAVTSQLAAVDLERRRSPGARFERPPNGPPSPPLPPPSLVPQRQATAERVDELITQFLAPPTFLGQNTLHLAACRTAPSQLPLLEQVAAGGAVSAGGGAVSAGGGEPSQGFCESPQAFREIGRMLCEHDAMGFTPAMRAHDAMQLFKASGDLRGHTLARRVRDWLLRARVLLVATDALEPIYNPLLDSSVSDVRHFVQTPEAASRPVAHMRMWQQMLVPRPQEYAELPQVKALIGRNPMSPTMSLAFLLRDSGM